MVSVTISHPYGPGSNPATGNIFFTFKSILSSINLLTTTKWLLFNNLLIFLNEYLMLLTVTWVIISWFPLVQTRKERSWFAADVKRRRDWQGRGDIDAVSGGFLDDDADGSLHEVDLHSVPDGRHQRNHSQADGGQAVVWGEHLNSFLFF